MTNQPAPGEGQFFTINPVPPPKPKASISWGLPIALGLLAIPLLMFGFGFAQQQQPAPNPSASPTATPSVAPATEHSLASQQDATTSQPEASALPQTEAATNAVPPVPDDGVVCITPRKGIFHFETVKSYCDSQQANSRQNTLMSRLLAICCTLACRHGAHCVSALATQNFLRKHTFRGVAISMSQCMSQIAFLTKS